MGAAPIHTAYHGLITHALPPSSHARVLHLPRASVQPVANATESVVWWFQSVIHMCELHSSFHQSRGAGFNTFVEGRKNRRGGEETGERSKKVMA